MSSTPDNTGVLPFAQDHLLTDEEFAILKSHVLKKLWDVDLPLEFTALLYTLINSLGDKPYYSNSIEFLKHVRAFADALETYDRYNDVRRAADLLTVTDAPVLIRLYKMLDANYFLQSIDNKIKYMN